MDARLRWAGVHNNNNKYQHYTEYKHDQPD